MNFGNLVNATIPQHWLHPDEVTHHQLASANHRFGVVWGRRPSIHARRQISSTILAQTAPYENLSSSTTEFQFRRTHSALHWCGRLPASRSGCGKKPGKVAVKAIFHYPNPTDFSLQHVNRTHWPVFRNYLTNLQTNSGSQGVHDQI